MRINDDLTLDEKKAVLKKRLNNALRTFIVDEHGFTLEKQVNFVEAANKGGEKEGRALLWKNSLIEQCRTVKKQIDDAETVANAESAYLHMTYTPPPFEL